MLQSSRDTTLNTHRVPSVKSVLRSPTSSPHSFRLTFTQFLKVLACICIHSSSLPRMCMLLAAWPSGDLAASPALSASDILLSTVMVATVLTVCQCVPLVVTCLMSLTECCGLVQVCGLTEPSLPTTELV